MVLYKAIPKASYVTLCAVWYHLCNLKNVKTTHGEVIHLVCNFTKSALLHGCFSRFLNSTNGTKPPKASDIKNVLSFIDFFFHTDTLQDRLLNEEQFSDEVGILSLAGLKQVCSYIYIVYHSLNNVLLTLNCFLLIGVYHSSNTVLLTLNCFLLIGATQMSLKNRVMVRRTTKRIFQ